jgi:oligopeptide transport system substrate-binding protein
MFRPDSSLNDSGWSNSEYERMIREASAKKLSKDRYAKLAEAEKLLLDEGVILPVAHNPSLNVLDMDGIAGWYPNALDIHPFKFVRFTQKKPLPGVALLH